MANTLETIGDVLIIKGAMPFIGIATLTNYIETVIGDTPTRTYTREFRYSKDGIHYSDWDTLSAGTLTALSLDPKQTFQVEFKYTRTGTATDGVITVSSVNLIGTFTDPFISNAYDDSVFASFFEDPNHQDIIVWSLNVLEKLYRPGIVANFFDRGETWNQGDDDRDYIDFWRAMTHFFGMIVAYGREFSNFTGYEDFMREYLRQKDLFLCDTEELGDMIYIMEHYYDEMRHRGTNMIIKAKGELINGVPKPVNGELLRLICYDDACDEFIFAISQWNRVGWVMDRWSGEYKGIASQVNHTKLWEETDDVLDLSVYPISNPSYVSLATDGDKEVMEISAVPAGQVAGIEPSGFVRSKATIVDPNLDYEFSFAVNQVTTADTALTVRLWGYDINGNLVSILDQGTILFPAKNDFFIEQDMPQDDKYFFVRCILFNQNEPYSTDPSITTPNILVGTNLRMTSDVCYVIPEIVLDNTSGGGASGTMRLHDIKFRLLKTDYSSGFLGAGSMINVWMKNNSNQPDTEITKNVKEKLINYNSSLLPNYL